MSAHPPLPEHPTVAVLVRGPEDGPAGMEDVRASATLRYAATTVELREALADADALFVWDFTSKKVRDAWDGASTGLRWVHVASTGVDPVLFPELVDSDVVLTNSREVFDGPIAEYVAGCVLALRRDLLGTLAFQRRHEWRHRETRRVAGQSAVVVGAGPIGRATAVMARALGCRVRVVASRRRDDDEFGVVYGVDELDGLLEDADVVIAALPLTSGTRGLFDARRLAAMKAAALFVNVSRGAVVDEDALVGALRDGRLAGAALDVFEQEPLPQDHPLWDMANVIVSPHMSGDFVGWRDVLARMFVDNFTRWIRGEPLEGVVDKRLGYVPTDRPSSTS